MKYLTLLLIQLLIPISCKESIESNPSVCNMVEESPINNINPPSVEETANVKDVVLQLPIPNYINPVIFDSVCSQVNVSAISRVKEADNTTLFSLVIDYFNQLNNLWLPIETSCAMRTYKAIVDSEDIDKQSYSYIYGDKVLIQFYQLYKLLDENKELLKEDTPLKFWKAIFKFLHLKEDLLYKSLTDANLESSLIYDCLSFSKDSENLCSLVESMSWEDFFCIFEDYLHIKNYVFCSLLNIISLKYLSPEEFSRRVESGTFEVPDSITLRELEDSSAMTNN